MGAFASVTASINTNLLYIGVRLALLWFAINETFALGVNIDKIIVFRSSFLLSMSKIPGLLIYNLFYLVL